MESRLLNMEQEARNTETERDLLVLRVQVTKRKTSMGICTCIRIGMCTD